MEIKDMKMSDIELRKSEILQELNRDITNEEMDMFEQEVEALEERANQIIENVKIRQAKLDAITNSTTVEIIKPLEYDPYERGYKPMENNLEVRSFQKYLTTDFKQLNDTEQRALDLSGAAAVVPQEIANKLITDEKYSTLLARATVFNDNKPGKLSIPIASNNAAVWKDQNSNVDSLDASYEKSPTLTNIVLGGHELYRWMRMSASAYSMSAAQFQNMMLNLLASELVEELEKAFVDGTGVGQPTGLEALSFTKDVNAIEVANGTAIAPKDIADAIALLSAKYARNSIVMCNTGTLADIALFKGTSEFAYNLSDGASKFLGHEIVVNEHVADNVIYVVDPKELYVRFAMPVQVESNHSSGFTQASIDLRALTVVDAAWNTKAVSKVYVKAIA